MVKLHRIGIFGGTFDPVHQGHLQLAETALAVAALDRVIWIPARHPTHKSQIVASYHHRRALVAGAIASYPQFELLNPPLISSYAIDSFLAIQACYPHSTYYWLLGLDSFASVPRWYRRQELSAQLTWLIAPRGDPQTFARDWQDVLARFREQNLAIHWQLLPLTPLPISSSAIRQAYRDNRDPWGLPESAREYIQNHNLY
jgi:nicotinate-nucleotide adenylyltransferase